MEQAFTWVGKKGKPKGVANLWRTADRTGLVGKLAPGKEIDIVGVVRSKKKCKQLMEFKACDAFLVKSSSGLVGWVHWEDLDPDVLPWAG